MGHSKFDLKQAVNPKSKLESVSNFLLAGPKLKTAVTLWAVFACSVVAMPELFLSPSPDEGWSALLVNQADSAEIIFQHQLDTANTPAMKAAALRGLSKIRRYHGDEEGAARYCLDAWNQTESETAIAGCVVELGLILRYDFPHLGAEARAIAAKILEQNPGSSIGAFLWNSSGMYWEKTGAVDSLRDWTQKLAPLSNWAMAGPFDNVSNSGLFRTYGPEDGFELTEKNWEGLSGRKVRWIDVPGTDPSGWIFLNHIQYLDNAVNYFATDLLADTRQDAILSLGVSGVFEVWLNGTSVMRSEVFRNTGIDAFQVRIKLNQGKNHILLKLGHEEKVQSNFFMRIKDSTGKPLVLKHKPGPQPGVHTRGNSKPQWIPHSLSLLLQAATEDNSGLEYQLARASYSAFEENFPVAKRAISALQEQYPRSGVLASQLAEVYYRQGNATLAELLQDRAYAYGPDNARVWNTRFRMLADGDDTEKAYLFYIQKPKTVHLDSRSMTKLAVVLARMGNQQAFLKQMEWLIANKSGDAHVAHFVYSVAKEIRHQTMMDALMKTILDQRKWSADFAGIIFEYLQSTGQINQAVEYMKEYLKQQPLSTGYYDLLADAFIQQKQYADAEMVMKKLIAVNPFIAGSWEMIGKSRELRADTTGAVKAYQQAVEKDFNQFDIANRIRELQGKKRWNRLDSEYDIDSLRLWGRDWKEGRSRNSLVLLQQQSLIVYPQRVSEIVEKTVVEILDPKGIDDWKEYYVHALSSYEDVRVLKALVLKKDGKRIEADRKGRQLVFTSLEAGDLIELEIQRRFLREGKLARHFESLFYTRTLFPRLISRFEVITPPGASYTVKQHHQSLKPREFLLNDYTRKVWESWRNPGNDEEGNMAAAEVSFPWIQVSSFPGWEYIVDWYDALSLGKVVPTHEMEILADSLFQGADSREEKIRRVHGFITLQIRYSFMSFRQSGFTPQNAAKSLATQVGDCKDMSVLGKALLQLAGVKSDLVLVQTRDDGDASILPSTRFNHCILAVDSHFIDFTAPTHSWNALPWSDQGGRALRITEQAKQTKSNIIRLPLMKPEREFVIRHSADSLLEDGTLVRKIATSRGGNFAASMRKSFRYQNEKSIWEQLEKAVRRSMPQAELQSLEWDGENVRDSLFSYEYIYRADRAGYVSSKVIVFPLVFSDGLVPDDLPAEKQRNFPLSAWKNWNLWGYKKQTFTLQLPQKYSVYDVPDNTVITTPFGNYSLTFQLEGNVLNGVRIFSSAAPEISPKDYSAYRKFLEDVVAADRGMLVLTQSK